MALHPPMGTTGTPRQPGLFDSLPPALDVTFADARRIQLDERSWLEHVPGWLRGSDQLFTELLEAAPWEQRERWMYDHQVTEPRLTAQYPDIAEVPYPMLHAVVDALAAHYGVVYRSLWINLYRNHRDSTAWHGDTVGRTLDECIVPVLSLGATRRFLIGPVGGGRSVVLKPAGGDLVVMGGRCQRDWRHCVPKQAEPTGARISINMAPSHG